MSDTALVGDCIGQGTAGAALVLQANLDHGLMDYFQDSKDEISYGDGSNVGGKGTGGTSRQNMLHCLWFQEIQGKMKIWTKENSCLEHFWLNDENVSVTLARCCMVAGLT